MVLLFFVLKFLHFLVCIIVILNNDIQVQSTAQTALAQMHVVENTTKLIKEFAEINYISKVTEEIYDINTKRVGRCLGEFYVNPKLTIFNVGDQFCYATDQEKVLQWLISRVKYLKNCNTLSENEIIRFIIS